MQQPIITDDTDARAFGVKLPAALIERIRMESVRRRQTIRAVMTTLLKDALPDQFEIIAIGTRSER